MTTALTPAPSFEERVRAKLRADIGELITTAELDRIIKDSMDDLFFKPSQPNPEFERMDYWAQPRTRVPPKLPCLAHRLAMERIQPLLEAAIEEWILQHHEEIKRAMKEAFEDGLPLAIMDGLKRTFTNLAEPSFERLRSLVETLK